MRIPLRIVIIGMLALATGMTVNLVYSGGIHPRQLMILFSRPEKGSFAVISQDSALVLMFENEAVFLDVRSEKQFQIDHIPNALSVPYTKMLRQPSVPSHIPRDYPWIVYDLHPQSKFALAVARAIESSEKKQPALLDGGYAAWLEKYFPVEEGAPEPDSL
ncbi:hypothetical protein JW948_11945 [bacterium]|nr:hypothetical protein [bacterium]